MSTPAPAATQHGRAADLGRVVRARRRRLGLRQEELADLAGCSERFVHALESGKPTVPLDKVLDVLAVLGDLSSSLPYGDTTMATSLGGRRKEDITRAVFLSFGASLGLTERAVSKAVDQQCAAVELWLPGLANLPFRRQVLDRWRRSVRYRQRMLSRAA